MCIFIGQIYCESLVKKYVLPNKNAVYFCGIFLDIGQCCRPAQTKGLENQKLGYVRINYDNIPYF